MTAQTSAHVLSVLAHVGYDLVSDLTSQGQLNATQELKLLTVVAGVLCLGGEI